MNQLKTAFLATAVVACVVTQAQAWPVDFQIVEVQKRGPFVKDKVTDGAIVVQGNPFNGFEFRGDGIEIIELGEYWIGLSCDQLSDALRSHLKVDAGQGLIVRDAHEGKAAAKAGLKPHDVLLQANGMPVSDVKELIAIIQTAGAEEMTLEIIRAGERKTVKVTPEKRPDRWRSTSVRVLPNNPISRYRWTGFGPGSVLAPSRPGVVDSPITSLHRMPDGVSVTIVREGGKPAKIGIKRGENEWNIGEDEIGKLPVDLQPHVRRLIRGPGQILWEPYRGRGPVTRVTPLTPVELVPETTVKPTPSRDQRRDELLRELRDELRQLSEKLEGFDKK